MTLFHNKEPGVARGVRAPLWAAGQGCLVGEVPPGTVGFVLHDFCHLTSARVCSRDADRAPLSSHNAGEAVTLGVSHQGPRVGGRKVGRVGESSMARRALSAGAGEVAATQNVLGGDAVTRPRLADRASRPPHPAAEAVQAGPQDGVLRFGPGVPAAVPGGDAGQIPKRVWRSGPLGPGRCPQRHGCWARRWPSSCWRQRVGPVLRFHHPAPVQVAGVTISLRTPIACGVKAVRC